MTKKSKKMPNFIIVYYIFLYMFESQMTHFIITANSDETSLEDFENATEKTSVSVNSMAN